MKKLMKPMFALVCTVAIVGSIFSRAVATPTLVASESVILANNGGGDTGGEDDVTVNGWVYESSGYTFWISGPSPTNL